MTLIRPPPGIPLTYITYGGFPINKRFFKKRHFLKRHWCRMVHMNKKLEKNLNLKKIHDDVFTVTILDRFTYITGRLIANEQMIWLTWKLAGTLIITLSMIWRSSFQKNLAVSKFSQNFELKTLKNLYQ